MYEAFLIIVFVAEMKLDEDMLLFSFCHLRTAQKSCQGLFEVFIFVSHIQQFDRKMVHILVNTPIAEIFELSLILARPNIGKQHFLH